MFIKRVFLVIIIILCLSFVNAVENSNETDSEDQKQEKYDPNILDEFNNQTWLRVIVYYQSDVENLNFDTIEERKEYIRNLTYSLFDYIPSTKMRNIKTGLSNSFTAEITKEGFDELIKNSKLSEIYLDTIGSVELDESDTSLGYKPQILEEFKHTKSNLSDCISEKKEVFGSMAEHNLGYIGIIFKENITEDEALMLLDSYNLSYDNKFPKYVTVKLTQGTDLEWICLFEEYEIVKYATLVVTGTTVEANNVTDKIINESNNEKEKEAIMDLETNNKEQKYLLWIGFSVGIIIAGLISFYFLNKKKRKK